MKCIKSKDGEIRRVSDSDADSKVLIHGWVFVPKSEWKALRKPVQKQETVSAGGEDMSIEEKRLKRKKQSK
jgi:hypothetical protein